MRFSRLARDVRFASPTAPSSKTQAPRATQFERVDISARAARMAGESYDAPQVVPVHVYDCGRCRRARIHRLICAERHALGARAIARRNGWRRSVVESASVREGVRASHGLAPHSRRSQRKTHNIPIHGGVATERNGDTRLSQIYGVGVGYPLYGQITTEPAGQYETLQSGPNALIDPSLLITLDA